MKQTLLYATMLLLGTASAHGLEQYGNCDVSYSYSDKDDGNSDYMKSRKQSQTPYSCWDWAKDLIVTGEDWEVGPTRDRYCITYM